MVKKRFFVYKVGVGPCGVFEGKSELYQFACEVSSYCGDSPYSGRNAMIAELILYLQDKGYMVIEV